LSKHEYNENNLRAANQYIQNGKVQSKKTVSVVRELYDIELHSDISDKLGRAIK
jgi:hypothetical protein